MSRDNETPDEYTFDNIERLTREYQELLGLAHWKIDVKVHLTIDDEPDPANYANEAYLIINDGYDEADLVVNAFCIKPGGLEEAVAHEMCHLPLRELDRLAHYAVPKSMRKHVKQAVDRAVTHVSRAMARMRESR